VHVEGGGGGRCLIVVWAFAQLTGVISLLSHNKVSLQVILRKFGY
jgi:hypothetical protein